MQKDETLTIILTENEYEATIINNYANGTSSKRIMLVEDVAKALNEMVDEQQSKGELLGRLPKGYLNALYSSSGNFKVWVTMKSEKRPLLYYGKTELVPFPNLLLEFEVSHTKVNRSKIYSFVGDAKEGMQLYRFPFGNVYDDGKICWGNMSLPSVKRLEEIEQLVGMFFSSETNDDLFRGKDFPTQRTFIEELKKYDDFPDKYLKSTGMNLSFK